MLDACDQSQSLPLTTKNQVLYSRKFSQSFVQLDGFLLLSPAKKGPRAEDTI